MQQIAFSGAKFVARKPRSQRILQPRHSNAQALATLGFRPEMRRVNQRLLGTDRKMVGNKTVKSSELRRSEIRRSAKTLLPFAIVAALAAGLSGCSESISSVSVPRFSELMRSYDDTLTAEEQKDAIADLQKDQAKASKN
ncbi:hypothetical protein [Methyloligella solikamskensis]|uniref:Uncharacterized protein n=1 Tax=Methyloligella solikamskensis TaxID=1177756 RepID=A0ABW3JAI8_9HYPH